MNTPDQLLSQAVSAARRGALVEAEGLCRRALDDFPGHFFASLILADVLARGNRMSEALAAYEAAGRINPGHAIPFSRAAVIRFRVAFGQPPRARRPAPDAPRRRIQMTNLGSNGRFGNQLLQYAFVRLYASEHNLVAELPDWIGRDLFDFDDPLPSAVLPRTDERDFDMLGALRGHVPEQLSERDVSGYFCGDTSGWGDRAADFRALYTPGRNVRSKLDHAWRLISSKGKTVVAIHLRHADFGYGRFWVAPTNWYLAWLRALWTSLNEPVLYIATDDVTLIPRFAEFSPLHARTTGVDIPGADFMVDHHILRHADHVAISNSSFSFTAAMLNERARSFARPHPDRRGLIDFNPWSAPVLLDPVISRDEVPAAEQAFLERLFHASDIVVHVGRHCSPWTNLARSRYPDMRVHELENGASLDTFRRDRNGLHIRHLVVEEPNVLPLAGASATLSHSRVDMVHFRSSPIEVKVPEELEQNGYELFALPEGRLEPAMGNAPLAAGSYVAIHERLIPLVLKQGTKDLDLARLCRTHGINARGVLHIGAHEGEELSTYDAMGVKQTVFVEANPAVHARLVAATRDRPDVVTVNRAIGDAIGRVTLHLASFDQSSSLLPMAIHRRLYPQIVPAGTVEVEATTLDVLAEELKLSAEQFNLLAIDVQGAEAKVLRGAGNVLQHIDAILVEVNFAELYEGGAQIEEIDDLLGSRGFQRVATVSVSHPSWADAFYIRSTRGAAR